MDASALTTPLAIFTAGVVTSVHCSAMCGPLTCAMLPQKDSPTAICAYHAGRAASYMVIGGILGALGRSATAIFTGSPSRFLPWVLIALFVAIGLGLEKRIPMPAVFQRLLLRLKFGSINKTKLAALLGLATPFLPCAPLYLVFGVALFSGSFAGGAKLMALFAAGTLPLYWMLQSQYSRLAARLSPLALQRSRKGLAWASAILLTFRVAANHGAGLSQIQCMFCQ